jgi:uncharacterized repeat protein (TIGR03803 family)
MNTALKTLKRNLFLWLALIALLVWTVPDPATAQTFKVLHNFVSAVNGAYPDGALILSSNVLYGVAGGAPSGNGTVFRMNIDGTAFTNLYYFSAGTNAFGANSDGASPIAGLILSGNTLYGTAEFGGASGKGTVFRINTDGSAFTNLHSFVYSDGQNPYGGLLLLGDTLYGTTTFGGVVFANSGTVFAVNTDGTGYTNLHVFTTLGVDGGSSYSGLIASGDTLYGTATGGGAMGYGVVFSVNTNGGGYSTLHSFPGVNGTPQTEGIYPYSTLVQVGNTLYGTAYQGGDSGQGLVFSLTTDGVTYTKLHSFTSVSGSPLTNSDGALPQAGLVLSGDTLYGTSIHGGTFGYGTLFGIKTNGTGFTNLHSLTANDGANPHGGLIFSNNTLYGMANAGGTPDPYGTIFSLSLTTVTPPTLMISLSGTNVVLAWPTNAPGFTLQFTTNLAASAVWSTNSSATTIVNGQFTVTNASTDTQKFYRLIQ